eukprot:74342_1
MTRVTTNTHSHTSNNYPKRPHGFNRNFKKSIPNHSSRGPLTSISTNKNRNRQNANKRSNPFKSFQPNKSGIITQYDDDDLNSDEPSDFSHFLTPQKGQPPTTHPMDDNHNNSAIHRTTSNSPSKHDTSGSNCVSSQSRSNQNVTLKDKTADDFIFAGLQRYNSMTVPFNKPTLQSTNTNHAKPHESNSTPKINNKFSLDSLPFDWSLKKSLYLISTEPFDWCSNIPFKIRNAALHNVSFKSLHINSTLKQKQYELYRNMIYYQYPHNKWDSLQLAMVHKFYMIHHQSLEPLQRFKPKNRMEQFGQATNSDENTLASNFGESIYNMFVDRMCEWMQSFHCLYGLFRQRFVSYIYIHFASFFNIVFCYDASDIPQIIITNTHQSFRNNLKKQNIEFCTPLNKKKNDGDKENMDEDAVDGMEIEELERNGIHVRINKKRKAAGLGLTYNNNERTTVLIEGKSNVHSFYDYFMNNMHRLCLSIKKCHDVPLLFCDKSFINAKCCLICITKNLSGSTENGQKMYTMQLNGCILPNVCHSIVQLLCSTKQNASISCQLYDKLCVGMNYSAKVKLFRKIKDEQNRKATSISKIEINTQNKIKPFIVSLQ